MGRELDVKVAKALGWEYDGKFLVPPLGDERRNWATEWDQNGIPSYMPWWSNNVGAAWTLVKLLPFFKLNRWSNHWQCQSVHCGAWGDHVMESECDGVLVYRCGCRLGEGDTAPEAICRAFLAWKEADDGAS